MSSEQPVHSVRAGIVRRGCAVVAWPLVGMLAVTGCAGSGDDPERALDSTPAPTTAASTSPPGPMSAETSTSTAPTTTTSTTTPAPSTTTLEDLRRAIEADLNEGEQALLAAVAKPADSDTREALGRYFTGRSLETVEGIVQRFNDENLLGRPNPAVPSHVVVQSVAQSTPSAAQAVVCRLDGGITFRVGADGAEEIVDPDPVRYTSEA